MIETQLAPEGAVVSESKMLPDSRTGEEREIDVCIEYKAGEHFLRIAVECRDRARKADVEWIDQLDGKYRHLPVHKVVAVSRKGFYTTAQKAAHKAGFETLALSEALDTDWEQLTELPKTVRVTYVRFTARTYSVGTDPDRTQVMAHGVQTAHRLFDPDGADMGLVSEFIASELRGHLGTAAGKGLIEHFDTESLSFAGEHGHIAGFSVTVKPDLLVSLYGHVFSANRLTVEFGVEVEDVEVDIAHFSYGESYVGVGRFTHQNVSSTLTVVRSSSGNESFGVESKWTYEGMEKQQQEVFDFPIIENDRSPGALHVFLHYMVIPQPRETVLRILRVT